MLALTIWQPWASLIIAGAKPWEWRGYPAPRSVIGQRIVIHAGARPARQAEIIEIVAGIRQGDSSLVAGLTLDLLDRTHLRAWPLASAIGTAVLGTPIEAGEWAAEHDLDSDLIIHSRWAWPLTDIRPLEPVIPARGAQGFWPFPEVIHG
jgi:hypothetical protein